MAIRHSRGGKWITEGELPGGGYAIEVVSPEGVSPGTFEINRHHKGESNNSPELPDYLRHSHGGDAGWVLDGYSEVVPTWHSFMCRVPTCPATNIWPCRRLLLREECGYCDTN